MSTIQVEKFNGAGGLVIQINFDGDYEKWSDKYDHSVSYEDLITVDFAEDGEPIGIELLGSAAEELERFFHP